MRLPFQRDPPRDPRAAHEPAAAAGTSGDDPVVAARLTARRRLIGAFALLAVGVVGFPILFETKPRPLPSDLPIVTAQGESNRAPASAPRAQTPRGAPDAGEPALQPSPAAARPAASPAAPAASAAPSSAQSVVVATENSAASAPRAAPPPAAATPAPPTPAPPKPALPAPPAPPAATQEPARTTPARAAAPSAPAAKPAVARPEEPAAAEGRFVVQVGAYADAATLRETRQKVEKLGLKTYTQVIESDAGQRTRVRVGPFGTRAEAQAAAAKLKAAGLPANLLTL